jgi:hypothetical protein
VTPSHSIPGRPVARPANRPAPVVRQKLFSGWGWIEWAILLQTVMPALLFIPAIAYSKMKVVLRVSAFGISLLAWVSLSLWGRPAVGRKFPAQAWLAAAGAWLALEIFHPTTNTLISGVAECFLNLAIMLPAYWATMGTLTTQRVSRVMFLLFLTNAAGALMGIAQFYQPDRFNPPVIPILEASETTRSDLSFTTADGRRVLRPCGLTDTPGGAGASGAIAALVGLAWALNPMPWWKRLFGFSLVTVGIASVLTGQARVVLVGEIINYAVLALLLTLQKDYRRLSLMGGASVLIFILAVGWVVREGGEGVMKRYYSLIEDKPTEVYGQSRGGFLRYTFEDVIWRYPLGGGLGRWGMVNHYFGDRSIPYDQGGSFWVEIQWTAWAIDGGIPLMFMYFMAILTAMLSMLKIALRCRDPGLAFWAAVLVALGLNTIAGGFVGCPFISPLGMQFWIMTAMVHAAGERAGYGTRRAVSLARAAARKAT